MKLRNILGVGGRDIISRGHTAVGTVTDVKTYRFLKVNTKPVRMGTLDGAAFPHRITFRYSVAGREYRGSRVLAPSTGSPGVGAAITVYYDPDAPENFAVRPACD